jgi:hypothetical protein
MKEISFIPFIIKIIKRKSLMSFLASIQNTNIYNQACAGYNQFRQKDSALLIGKAALAATAVSIIGGFCKSFKHAGQVGMIAALATSIFILITPYCDSKKLGEDNVKWNKAMDILKISIPQISSLFIAKTLGFGVNMRQVLAKYAAVYIIIRYLPGPINTFIPTYS